MKNGTFLLKNGLIQRYIFINQTYHTVSGEQEHDKYVTNIHV